MSSRVSQVHNAAYRSSGAAVSSQNAAVRCAGTNTVRSSAVTSESATHAKTAWMQGMNCTNNDSKMEQSSHLQEIKIEHHNDIGREVKG